MRHLRLTCACVASVIAAAALSAEDGAKPQLIAADKPVVLSDQTWKLLSVEGNKEVGSRRLVVNLETSKPGDGRPDRIVINETSTMFVAGKAWGYATRVTYSNVKSAPSPIEGSAKTTVGGVICMEGVVTFMKEGFKGKQTVLSDGEGKPLDAPNVLEWDEEDLPKGPLLFRSAMGALAPRILDAPGELKDVGLLEFPFSVNVLIDEFSCRLTRRVPGEDGSFDMELINADGATRWTARFDAKGVCLEQTLGKMKMVPAKP